jgi:serine/threonine protein phosphatase 1
MKTVTYAIGDIHGRLDLLDELLALIAGDADRRNASSKVVFLGDYVDRGSQSYGVIERLISGPRRSSDVFVCLRGNHDDLFVKAVTTGDGLPDWAWFLYDHTTQSYDAGAGSLMDGDRALRRHARFLAGLPLTHDDGVNLFVHAGIRPGVSIANQTDEDLTWIRHEFLDYTGPLPRRVVHGHTIMGDRPVVTSNRVSIDTGAYRSGLLTAAVFDGAEVTFLQSAGAPDEGAIAREADLVDSLRYNLFPPRPPSRPMAAEPAAILLLPQDPSDLS